MKLIELCKRAGMEYRGTENPEIDRIVADSREATAGSLFLCIPGMKKRTEEYLAEAIQKGACAVAVSKTAEVLPMAGVTAIFASDMRVAAARLCNAFFDFPGEKLKLIGVTGTNGKSTVCKLIKDILEEAGHRVGIIGTLGSVCGGLEFSTKASGGLSNMTTPDPWVLFPILAGMVAAGMEYAVMEVSSHALALSKVEPLHFAAGVFTNLSPEHLDFHGTMENYAAAKAKLFAKCDFSVINIDSEYADLMKTASLQYVTTSLEKGADDYASDIKLCEDGVRYSLHCGKETMEILCPIAGRFTVQNSMQAAACAKRLGIDSATVRLALSHTVGVKGRMERILLDSEKDISALIDYAHTPDALEQFLMSAKATHRRGRILLLFGCGGERDREKRPKMGSVAEALADEVFLTSDNPRGEEPMEIIKEILSGFHHQKPRIVIHRAQAIKEAVMEAKPGDLILLAGKGHEDYELISGIKRPFSEREILFAAYEEKRKIQYES